MAGKQLTLKPGAFFQRGCDTYDIIFQEMGKYGSAKITTEISIVKDLFNVSLQKTWFSDSMDQVIEVLSEMD